MTKERFDEKLTKLLKTNPDFIDDTGELLRDKIKILAWEFDHNLINLLLSDPEVESKFFEEVNGRWIFNNNTFVDYINDKNFLSDSYTQFKNKIGLNIDNRFLRERGEVALVWPYKDCVLEGGQLHEEEKRQEIFFNELLAQDEINRMFDPKVLTNWKRHTVTGEEEMIGIQRDQNGMIRENLIIKGNNLIALHTLKQQFDGKVKLIYIDPPYNTGKDSFGYNDRFNHSSWLTFMKNRLEAAWSLLRDDGLFWISLSDKEAHYCKMLADEIFDQENFVADVIWNSTKSVTNTAVISNAHTHNLLYAKRFSVLKANRTSFRLPADERMFSNPDNDSRGKWVADPFQVEGVRPNQQYEIVNPNTSAVYRPNPGCSWKNEKKVFDELLKDNRIVFGVSGEAGPQRKRFWSEAKERGRVTTTLWKDLPTTTNGTQHLNQLSLNFKNPKPEGLLERIIQLSTDEGDIVLDYHLGSGTTAAAAHKLNRQWIAVEQMDDAITTSMDRLKQVLTGEQGGISKSISWQGGGDFIYCELRQYNEAFMDRIQSAESSEELFDILDEMSSESFLNWYIKPEFPEEAADYFTTIDDIDKQKQLLACLLDKNHLYVHLSEIEDEKFGVSESDKVLNRDFYGGEDDA